MTQSQALHIVTRSPGTGYYQEPCKSQNHLQNKMILTSHLLVPLSSPEPGSKKVTFLPSPGFFMGVLKKRKRGHEHKSNCYKISFCCLKKGNRQKALPQSLTAGLLPPPPKPGPEAPALSQRARAHTAVRQEHPAKRTTLSAETPPCTHGKRGEHRLRRSQGHWTGRARGRERSF